LIAFYYQYDVERNCLTRVLNKAIEDLSVTERSASLEAKLAAAIGARLANWGE
jgi:hypothetical protein